MFLLIHRKQYHSIALSQIRSARSELAPQELGVCWKNGYTFVRVESEILSQAKVGGRAGSTFTYGLRAQPWDAYINGPTSRNRIKGKFDLCFTFTFLTGPAHPTLS